MLKCMNDYICAYSSQDNVNQAYLEELYLLEHLEQQVDASPYSSKMKAK